MGIFRTVYKDGLSNSGKKSLNLFFKLNTGIFCSPSNNDFSDSEGKQTDLFVPNGTHAKKRRMLVLTNLFARLELLCSNIC